MKPNEQIKAHRWFSGRDCVGAVLVGVDGRLCAYIGVAGGGSEESDVMRIRSFGSRLPFDVAAAMFPGVPELTPLEYSDESI